MRFILAIAIRRAWRLRPAVPETWHETRRATMNKVLEDIAAGRTT